MLKELNENITRNVKWCMRMHRMNQLDLSKLLGTNPPQISHKLRNQQYWQLDELVKLSTEFKVELSLLIHEDLSRGFSMGGRPELSIPVLWNMGSKRWSGDVFHFQTSGPGMFFHSSGIEKKEKLTELAVREWKKRFSAKGHAISKRWSGNFMNDYLPIDPK